MFAFFDQISSLISSVIDFVVTIFENLIRFFQMLFSSLSFVVQMCAALPTGVQAAALCLVCASVVFLIVGR